MIYYICNRKREKCHEDGKTCWEDCHLTSDEKYALNGPCSDPENHPERFTIENTIDGIVYEEKEAKCIAKT
jgi:hypothetical protein